MIFFLDVQFGELHDVANFCNELTFFLFSKNLLDVNICVPSHTHLNHVTVNVTHLSDDIFPASD
jgi:hypothetical protein